MLAETSNGDRGKGVRTHGWGIRPLIAGWMLAGLPAFTCLLLSAPQGSTAAASAVAASHASTGTPQPVQYRAVMDRYCVGCHNQKARTAGLALDAADVENIPANPEIWEKVSRRLRTGTMPPAGVPRPDAAAYSGFAAYLETALDRSSAARPNPGAPVAHRLNRAEYANAVRDFLGVEVSGEDLFPAEDAGRGFDNLGTLLSVSPLLMERYMTAATKVSRLALGDADTPPAADTYLVSDSPRAGGLITVQDDRASDDLPFGTRGGIAFRHHFVADGEYEMRIRLQQDGNYYVRGLLGEPHQLDVFMDGARIRSFSVGGERHGGSGALHSRQGGIYIGDPAEQAYEFFLGEEHLKARFQVKAGLHRIGVAFLKKTYAQEGLLEVTPRPMANDIRNFKGGDPGVSTVTITGPYDAAPPRSAAGRDHIFICYPQNAGHQAAVQPVSLKAVERDGRASDEAACARKILAHLARLAYRRPVTDEDLSPLLKLYHSGSEGGFEAGIRTALEGILISPAFLFRIERDPSGTSPSTTYPVSGLDLASRLSFFLWSSIPDDTLLKAAERGDLKNPEKLESHVRRMLTDRRSRSLVSNFAGQWLYLRNVPSVTPNNRLFPDFDTELRAAFLKETELFFESMLRDDRGVAELLDADYTFLNERLAQHYGIPDVFGSHFRRVPLSDEKRRGLLGHGSILTVTSRANRTAPVLRGKWVLENLLGTPPPPPPPDVPALSEKPADVQEMTMRQRMEAHRTNPGCASCHAQMDPIGFALENFDAVGRWRTSEGRSAIDGSGVLPDGTRFQGPAELRRILLGRRDQIARTVTEKLMTYALGRELDSYDMPAVRKILAEAAPGGYRWSSLILGVIRSVPFQMRRSQS